MRRGRGWGERPVLGGGLRGKAGAPPHGGTVCHAAAVQCPRLPAPAEAIAASPRVPGPPLG